MTEKEITLLEKIECKTGQANSPEEFNNLIKELFSGKNAEEIHGKLILVGGVDQEHTDVLRISIEDGRIILKSIFSGSSNQIDNFQVTFPNNSTGQ